jgi:hypothetical protein
VRKPAGSVSVDTGGHLRCAADAPGRAADSRTTLQCLLVTPVSVAVQKLVDRLVAEINLLEVSGVWTPAGVICCMHKSLDLVHMHCSLWLAVYSRGLPALVPGFVP